MRYPVLTGDSGSVAWNHVVTAALPSSIIIKSSGTSDDSLSFMAIGW